MLPLLLPKFISLPSNFAIGGTSLLIVVSVVIEIIKKIDAQLTMHDYEGFLAFADANIYFTLSPPAGGEG